MIQQEQQGLKEHDEEKNEIKNYYNDSSQLNQILLLQTEELKHLNLKTSEMTKLIVNAVTVSSY